MVCTGGRGGREGRPASPSDRPTAGDLRDDWTAVLAVRGRTVAGQRELALGARDRRGRRPSAARAVRRPAAAPAAAACALGADDLGDAQAELLVDDDDLAAGDRAAVDQQVDGLVGQAVQRDDRARAEAHASRRATCACGRPRRSARR